MFEQQRHRLRACAAGAEDCGGDPVRLAVQVGVREPMRARPHGKATSVLPDLSLETGADRLLDRIVLEGGETGSSRGAYVLRGFGPVAQDAPQGLVVPPGRDKFRINEA
jgi:hypothetical protein